MYPPNSSKSTAHDGGGDADTNQYDSAAGATRDFSSLGPQTHHHPPPQRQQQHQQNPNLVGHYLPGEPSSIGFDSNASSSSSLFRHRSSPAGFYDQHLPTDPNGTGFSLGRPNGGYGGGGEQGPSRLKSELRFSSGSSSHQEHNSLPRISEVEAAAAARNGVASSSMSFGNNRTNNWDNSSSHISFTIDQPGKRSKNSDFFTLETQYSMPQTTLEMATMENLMNIPEDSVPCRARAKRGFATHPRSIAERERRTRISGKLKKLQELVPNMDKQTSYADMLDLAVEHIKGLQHQVEVRP
uniref:Transcription factor bHLH129 n=1 Tax=Arabidopsis thaliana TaxID=3702 RepID=BH129_ARATH|nr:RecName: Full=Transcription factor bHLH129; AltName: Full=Basic helix-loop-helix protein 129; Short=AtbHLH129; Short=bHLH 129; AltName: Full=Transcription factor EN 73; AltName: Full=bHLH transcription factor bHLH129 [Arabidopsis thaliana]